MKAAASDPPEWTPVAFFEAEVCDRYVVDVRLLVDSN